MVITSKIVLLSLLSLLAFAYGARRFELSRDTRAQQCQLQRITTSQPYHRIESEGGTTEVWDPSEDQFQCAGVASFRDIIQPNSLCLPKFFPAPRLVYIVRGRGVVGVTYPGCPETFHPEQQGATGGQGQTTERRDRHQRVHSVQSGDVIAIPEGAVSWCYNDGNEELVSVSVLHLNNRRNQLDQNLRAFVLGGGQSREERRSPEGTKRYIRSRRSETVRETFQNVFRSLDEEMLAEAFNVPTEIVRRMKGGDSRGTIVSCDSEMRIVRPDEREEEDYRMRQTPLNGVEETFCSMRLMHNLESRRESDFYTREAGRINIVNEQKLPILAELQMSAERGYLMPNAMHTPHWSMTDHRVVYALRGTLHVQVVDDDGNTVMDETVNPGDMFVIPQFYVTVGRAGRNGFEYVTFKTFGQPMKHPMAGYTSVLKAMPVDVLANSYQMSPVEADLIKRNRDPQTMLLSPTRRRS